MKKVLKLLDEHAEEYLAFAFFSMMLFALFVQVVLRYTGLERVPCGPTKQPNIHFNGLFTWESAWP